jgi:hypothetical protein
VFVTDSCAVCWGPSVCQGQLCCVLGAQCLSETVVLCVGGPVFVTDSCAVCWGPSVCHGQLCCVLGVQCLSGTVVLCVGGPVFVRDSCAVHSVLSRHVPETAVPSIFIQQTALEGQMLNDDSLLTQHECSLS